MIDEFLTDLRNIEHASPNTIRLRRIYLCQLAAQHSLAAVTTSDLRHWLANPGWAPRTINVATATVRSFYHWAQQSGRLTTNPAEPLHYLHVRYSRARLATPEQIRRGISSEHADVRAMTRLGAECGLRVHEIAKLRTNEVGPESITLAGKGGVIRTVFTSPELRQDLALLHPVDGWYFPSPTRPHEHLTPDAVRARIKHELGTNPHSLRHRAGTVVYRRTGNNLRIAQVFLGHSSPATTAIYVHVNDDDLRAASAAARIAA